MDNTKITGIVDSISYEITKQKSTYPLDTITLNLAQMIAKRIEDKASEIGVRAVIAICSAQARPVLIHCMNDSYIASYDIALGKAYTSASIKMPTKELKVHTQPGGSLYGIQNTNDGKIVIFGGGEPLMLGGRIIGALGVSGGNEKQDTFLAEYGASVLEEEAKKCLQI